MTCKYNLDKQREGNKKNICTRGVLVRRAVRKSIAKFPKISIEKYKIFLDCG